MLPRMPAAPRRRLLLSAAGMLAACRSKSAGGGLDAGSLPTRITPLRPRLLVTPAQLGTLDARLARDEVGRRWRDALFAEAARLHALPPVEWRTEPRRPVLLPTSREVLRRVEALGASWLLTGDRRHVRRLAAEMERVCGFPTWNPTHFLDVAEMSMAVALAHDWCHAAFEPAERARIESALVEKALVPGLEQHRRKAGWTRATHNWNLVCNGGLAAACLTIAEAQPALAAELLDRCVESARLAFASYAPDGGWDEGPAYWDYATQYAVFLVAALESALGDDLGFAASPGFARAGDFRLHMEGPSGRAFNFADGGERVRDTPALMWLSGRFGRPVDAWLAARSRSAAGSGVLWFQTARSDPAAAGIPRDMHFRHVNAVSLRGGWNDRTATWVGFKAGDNAANHSHLDLGTFVLDATGERFAVDLGGDDYALPGYFDSRRRFDYYRLGTAGQNTLLIDGANQPPRARCPIIGLVEGEDFARAVADLDAAYPAARRVRRGIALLERRSVVVADEIDLPAGYSIRWQMHTRARIETSGARAVLRQGAATLELEILAPDGARFTTEPATRAAPENANDGVTRLCVDLMSTTRPLRLTILIRPAGAPISGDALARASGPLDRWLHP
jgi:hypothetical protein